MNPIIRGLLAGALSLLTASAYAQTVSIPRGKAHVSDGDSIIFQDVSYRLHGIDAPERSQHYKCNGSLVPAGLIAMGQLQSFMRASKVTCEVLDTDHYGRRIVRCLNGYGADINQMMVRLGYAFAYDKYSTDYVADQAIARDEGAGFWQYGTDLEMPWDWRARN